MGAGTDGDDPVERLLDLFVYAPIGLLATGGEHLDDYIRKGRASAAMARTVGQFALQGVDARLGRSVSDIEGMAREFLGIVVANMSPSGTRSPSQGSAPPAPPSASSPAASDGVDDLVEGYDHMTAREVLPLLDGLDGPSLDRIEAHERATRNRSTVLARIRRARG